MSRTQGNNVTIEGLAGLYRSISDTPHNLHGRTVQKSVGSQAYYLRRRPSKQCRGLIGKRGISAPLPSTSVLLASKFLQIPLPPLQPTRPTPILMSNVVPRTSYFTADQFERCIIELCYDHIIRHRGDSPAKVLPNSDHRVVDLDVFLEKQSTASSLKTPAPQRRASRLLGAHPRVDTDHAFIYQVSATRLTKHKRNSVARSRSIKRVSSQKRFESGQNTLKDDTRIPSMERLLEILATIVSRAPEQWVPSNMIDVFIQSQGHTIQELIEKLPTKTSQYIMFLVLKIASTWVETSSALKATRISSPIYTSTSDLIDESNHLSQGFAANVDLEALRLEARNTIAKKLAAHVFLRPLQVEVSTPSPQALEYPHSQSSHSEVDAIAAFEILLLSYENLGLQRKKSKDTAGFGKSSKYPTRKSSLSALKRNSTLTPADIPSLPLPPWRKMARNKVDSENTDNYKGLISEAKTLLIQHESQARVIPSGDLESPLSANQEVEPLNSSDMSSSSQYNSDCIPHPVSAMINLPARRNPQQHLADPVPNDSGGLSTDNPNTGSFPWATSASQDAISECIDFDSQFNSELLVRAAAAAYNCRSSYIGTRSREQSQQQQQSHQSQSKAKACDVIVDYQSQIGHSSSTFWPDSLSSYHSSPISVPETEISEDTLFSSVDGDERLRTHNQDVSQAQTNYNGMLLTSALDESSFNSKLHEKFDDSTTLVMTEPPLVEVPVAFAIGESLPRVAALTPLSPVLPLRIVKPLECKSTKRHRPPPFDLRSSSLAHSQKSSQTPALNQPMAKSFVKMMSAKLDAQANKATEAIQQGNVTEDNRGTENLSLKKGRYFWRRSSLLPKRKSGNKVDLIPGPSAANSIVQCISPLGVPHYLKGTTDQSDSLFSPETMKFVDGNTKTTTATISAKTRRHMQSKSQDYTGGLPQDITRSLGIPHGKTIRQVRSGTALNSSAKAISMPLPEQPSSSILRSNARGAVSKVSSPSTDTFPKAMAGWSTLLWRNPFQPPSPSQESSEGNELPKQRNPLEEPASPVSPSLPIHLGLRRKKSMYEKLLGKWSKKLPSLTSPLSSPRFPSGISNSDSSSGNLDLSYFERQSTSYFSAFGSPVTSPTFQSDENGMFKIHESQGCRIYLPNETHDSDDEDGMGASASQIRKKGKNNNKAKIPLGESRTKELYQQDEVLKRMADLATDDSYIRKRSEDSCSRSRFEALWIDEDDYDGDGGDEYYEYHDGYFGGSDEEFFDFETGGYESKILRKPGRESRSEAYIQRVMEQWQVWSVAHAAIY